MEKRHWFFFQLWFFDLFGYSLISWMFFATSSFFFSVLSNLKCNGLEYTVSTFSTARPTKTGLRCLTLVWPQAHIDETQFFPPEVVGHYLEALCPGIKSASATFLGRYSAEGTNIENQASKYIIVSTIYIYIYINDVIWCNLFHFRFERQKWEWGTVVFGSIHIYNLSQLAIYVLLAGPSSFRCRLQCWAPSLHLAFSRLASLVQEQPEGIHSVIFQDYDGDNSHDQWW